MSGVGKIVPACVLLAVLGTCAPAPEGGPTPRFVERDGTGVESENLLTPTEEMNIVEYLYFYNGGGVAATDINGDGLADLYFTNNQLPNRYYINEGNWKFRDATEEGGVAGAGNWTTGISVTDINRDGLPDLYVCAVGGYKSFTGRNELFVQQPGGKFIESAKDYGLAFNGFNTQAYWFDYDGDGDDDMYLLRHSVHSDATYRDGAARNVRDSLAGDLLLRNDEGQFRDVTAEAGLYSSRIGYGLSVAVADYDGNGFPDIYVCNDFSENDYLYLNDGAGHFTESIRERTGHTSNFSMGSDVGDLDNDGRPDLITLDMRPGEEHVLKSTVSTEPYNLYRLKRRSGYHDQLPRNGVQWNRGGGNFSEIGELSGLAATDWSWSVLIEDFDLDGVNEVFVSNGIERRPNDLDYLKFIGSSASRAKTNLEVAAAMPPGQVANQLFVRDSSLRYRSVDWGLGLVGSTTGAAVADLDGDGDPDLVLNNVNAPVTLYENTLAAAGQGGARHFARTAQRGFLSQSEVTRPQPNPVSPPTDTQLLRILARSTDLPGDHLPAGGKSSFDREPLQPFAGAIPEVEARYTLVAEEGEWKIEAGPWRPLRIGRRTAEGWEYETVAGTRGLWQCVAFTGPTGREEIIAGNWGLNSSLGKPTSEEPLRLYLPDLDGNGRRDPLVTYVRDGREYSLADKDELSLQLPGWRRNNLSYADFSGRDFPENFPDLEEPPLVAETLAHLRLRRDASGKWQVTGLPEAAQITPVRVIQRTSNGILLGGNALEVLPRVGRQDAAALQLLREDGSVELVDLGGAANHLEVGAIHAEGEGLYRVYFTDESWVLLRVP